MTNNNVPAFQVMALMGHGFLKIVLAYYHTSRDELIPQFGRAAVRKTSREVGGFSKIQAK